MLYSYSEIECLLRDGVIYVEFKYAWHSLLPRKFQFDRDKKLQMVEDCLKHGANQSNRGGPGVTALMLTCKHLNDFWGDSARVMERVVSLLLDQGAEVNQQDFYGSTALHYAFKSGDDTEERPARKQRVVKILIQHNADIYLKDSSGLSAFDMAKRWGYDSWLRTDEASLTGARSKKGKTSCSII
jgi:ankyrin repeat protein